MSLPNGQTIEQGFAGSETEDNALSDNSYPVHLEEPISVSKYS